MQIYIRHFDNKLFYRLPDMLNDKIIKADTGS